MWERPQYATDWYQTWRRAAEAGRSMPETANYNDLADSVAAALQEIILKQADPAQTLQRYQNEFNRRYAKP
jgi:maltose-binding protein MalE